MKRIAGIYLHAVAGLGLFLLVAPAQAAQFADIGPDALARNSMVIQVAGQGNPQTATMPLGTIRLRVIPEVGGKATRERIHWRVMTYGKDSTGRRQQVAEVTEATPELVLPAGWYVVHAEMKGKTIKHPVEVTAGKTFKYTLVKQ